ncbi:hypothetical protein ACXZ1M_25600 [Duganella sp. PWIR1]
MNRKLNTAPVNTEQPYLTNDRPAILGGAQMDRPELPPGFDLSYHKKVLASGKIKPATEEDFANEIASLKQKIKNGLG